MRWWLAPIALALGCAPTMPPPPPPPTILAVDDSVFGTKVTALRATLARHGVEIDTVPPVIDTCVIDPTRPNCVSCEVATRANTAGIDPDLIDGVSIAFGAYPPALIQAAGLEHVALCRTIRIAGEDGLRPPAGVAVVEQHRLLISIEQFGEGAPYYKDFSVQQVVHHEVFHLFDEATEPSLFHGIDQSWHALNPPDFAYRNPAIRTPTRPTGFVNSYATTNEQEDRATVFEFLLGQPAALCEIAHRDPAVAAKTAAVWKRVAKFTGDKLLRQQAPCVDWIGKARKAAPAKKRPKRTGPVNLRIRSTVD
jgi:hypothetical protein